MRQEYFGIFFPAAIVERNKTNLKIKNYPNTTISKRKPF